MTKTSVRTKPICDIQFTILIFHSVDDAKEGRALPLNEMRILRGEPDPDFKPLPGDDGYNWIMAAPQILLDDSGTVEAIFGW
jgi:hypothetical protein